MDILNSKNLSKEMLKDLKNYQFSGEDAIFLLGNYRDLSTEEIIARLQSSRIFDIIKSGLKTEKEWKEFSAPLKNVRTEVCPIYGDKYSCYALKENENAYGHLRYPLCSSFASKSILFSKKTFPKYNELVSKIKKVYKVKIVEKNDQSELFRYKKENKIKAIIKNIAYGALNLCRKLFKKEKLSSMPNYRGKIIINNNLVFDNKSVYKISEQEKFTKILDGILAITTKNAAKKLRSNLSDKELFFSRLYSEVLLSRAIDYGDPETNRKIEDSLTLQMSNVLAGLNMSNSEINEAARIGFNVALVTIKRLGLTLEDVKKSVLNAGYKYDTMPTSIEEALLPKHALKYNLIETKDNTKDNEDLSHKENTTEKEDIEYKPNFVILNEDTSKTDKNNNQIKKDFIDVEIKEKDNDENKYSDKIKLIGVKDTKTYLTKNSAKKYIDRVIESNFKKQIDKSVGKILLGEAGEKKLEKLNRQYNFVEHMLSFYNKNKDVDSSKIEEIMNNELYVRKDVADNNYAHSFGKSFVDLRQDILNEIFGDKETIEKKDGKTIISLINDYVEQKYGKKLSSFVLNALNKNLNAIYKEIDKKEFTPKVFDKIQNNEKD